MNVRWLPGAMLVALAIVWSPAALLAEEPPVARAAEPQGEPCFTCTQVIGYSQVGQRGGGWFVAGGVFESIVGDDHWQLLWNGGAGVDRWRNSDYPGWLKPLISPCKNGSDKPDRVLLSVSGPYGSDEAAWAEAIEATVKNIREKIPTARQIILQPVVGGPGGKECRNPRGGRVRASWQHQHIANAIQQVAARAARSEAEPMQVVAGFSPTVRAPEDYTDGLGHLTPDAAQAVGKATAEYYARQDAECRAKGHPNCGLKAAPRKTADAPQ